jgi:hypothetical protein
VPTSVRVLTGTQASGTVSSLSADDGSYYVVSALNSSAQWSASFTGLPSTMGSLTVTYNGHPTASCTQNLSLWNWYYNAWVAVAHTTAGTSDATLTIAAPGLLSDYIAIGELRVGLQCFRTDGASFNVASDLAKITYS